jgi:hypothetical protein
MPVIIPYDTVLQSLTAQGLRCNYYNGGAFGFPAEATTIFRGWIGSPDASIRPEMLAVARKVDAPLVPKLAEITAKAWERVLPGIAWIMPMSHWHFELTYGSRAWLPGLLAEIAIDAAALAEQANAAAIEFAPADRSAMQRLVAGLLDGLTGSDFSIAFPGRPCIAVLHHHKQVWWMTSDANLAAKLDAIK